MFFPKIWNKQTNKQFVWRESDNQIEFLKYSVTNNTVCNVQPSQKLTPGLNTLLPYLEENLDFLRKLHFQNSDLIDSEYSQLNKSIVVNKNSLARLRTDIGNNSILFQIRVKLDAKLQKTYQSSSSKWGKANELLDDMQKIKLSNKSAQRLMEK